MAFNLPQLPIEQLSKLLLPILVVGIAAGGMGGYTMLGKKDQQIKLLQVERDQSRQEAEQLKEERDKLLQEKNLVMTEKKKIEDQLASIKTQMASASEEVEKSKLTIEELKKHEEQFAQERSDFQRQVAGITSERDQARSRIQEMEHDNSELERSLDRLRQRIALLDRDYQKLTDEIAALKNQPNPNVTIIGESGPTNSSLPAGGSTTTPQQQPSSSISSPLSQATVELPPIIVRKDQAGMSMPVRGRVLDVNESHNFIVVDKGSMDGVRMGMAFDIQRGTASVGRVTVVRVRPKLSACDIIRSKTASPLQPGDVAVQGGL